ncbi:hypothetical protein AVEN_27626-1 [Araneus ventricosus]|uniref:Uncharacterized protein n=1 Tax=Araneus ventricosus TaxID=182803 RepID=A0A4Y2ERG0_ARAVE|nr:hypothetical protein AVEN_27626-1 [Araneus ventricosus]
MLMNLQVFYLFESEKPILLVLSLSVGRSGNTITQNRRDWGGTPGARFDSPCPSLYTLNPTGESVDVGHGHGHRNRDLGFSRNLNVS